LEQILRWYSLLSTTPEIAKQAASQLFAIPWWHNVVILSKSQSHAEALSYVQQTQALHANQQGQLPSINVLEAELKEVGNE